MTQVRINLQGPLLIKAERVREFYGVSNYADLFRVIITEKHRQITKETKP